MNRQSLVLDVQSYMQHHLPQYVEELCNLCAIDSGSYHKPGLDEMAKVLATRLRGLGMDVTIFEQEQWGNDLLGVIHGDGGGTMVLLGHIDTVYPVGTAAVRPVRVEGNTVYGPGVSDMKGCILSAIYALEALLASGYRSFGEIRILCVSDEELNTRHSEDLIHRVLRDCQAALALEAGRSNGDIVSARKGQAYYTLKAHGQGAHSGVEPEKGRNAIIELAHQVLQFQRLNRWHEGIAISANIISGGTAANVIPDYAEATIDLRYLQYQDRIATEQLWQEAMQQRIVPDVVLRLEASPQHKHPMVRTPESMKLVHLAQDIAGMLEFALEHALTGGSGDAGYASQNNIPAIDGLGPVGGFDHSPNEYLQLDSVAPRTALLAGLIASIGSQMAP